MKLAQKMALRYFSTKIKILEKVSVKRASSSAFKLFGTPFVKHNTIGPKVFEKGTPLQIKFMGKIVRGYKFGMEGNPKILIIHGWESCVFKFDKYIKPFTEMGLQVYMFDAIAHGNSEGKNFNVKYYADLITTLCENFGPFNNFMAHSLGGMALSMAVSQQSAIATPNAKIVLIAPGGEAQHFFNSFYKLLKISPAVQKGMEAIVVKLSGHTMEWFSTKKHIVNINLPVLWLHDEEDDACPIKYAYEVADLKLPNIKFHFSKGLGHSIIYRNDESKKRIFDFIKH
jgi:pimeloyl-ACP methyl ester carboxylesterase